MNPDSRPPRSRLFRFFRATLLIVVALVTLGALLWAFENWRGERAWQALLKEHTSKGDPLDAPATQPAVVPDDQNVAMTPLLKPLMEYDMVKGQPVWRDPAAVARVDALALPAIHDGKEHRPDGHADLTSWQTAFRATNYFRLPLQPSTPPADVLLALQVWSKELDELEAATRRPHSKFPFHTQETVNALLPQLARGKAISRIIALRATARLVSGDSAGAMNDLEFNERWARALAGDPLLINELVAIAIETIGTHVAWEGLAFGLWKEPELIRLQAMLAARNPRADLSRALRGERAFGIAFMEVWVQRPETLKDTGDPWMASVRHLPRGFVRQNQISLVRFYDLLAEESIPWSADRLPTSKLGTEPLDQLREGRPRIYSQLAAMLAPAIVKAMAKSDRLLAISRMGEIACALERYHLVHQTYPENLDQLLPTLLAKVPLDPCTGKAFQYHRQPDGTFRLYSLGMDGRDDGGEYTGKDEQTDWPWPLPVETKKRLF